MSSLVIIAYKKDTFVKAVQGGPFNELSILLWSPNTETKKIFSKQELIYLKPFDLYETHDMEIEDVSGWDDEVFKKGKKDRVLFQRFLVKVHENLPILLGENAEFYLGNLAKVIEEITALPKEVDFITFYDL